jgi:hypothetical protein
MQDFQYIRNSCIFFNSSTNEKEKDEIKSLILETCQQIERKNAGEIEKVLDNIEFIVYKHIEGDSAIDVNRSPDGGVTLKCEIEKSETQKSCWRCFVIYYPLKRFQYRETQLYILAHEFAHAFYQHPINTPHPSRLELEKLDHEADLKAIEWDFKPHEGEESTSYKKYFGKKP